MAFNSRRKVPPGLVDTSSYRIRSGALKGDEVVEAAERYDTRLLFLFSDGLREIKKFDDYVDAHYRAVKIAERQNAKDRALYLRDDADLAAARGGTARTWLRKTQRPASQRAVPSPPPPRLRSDCRSGCPPGPRRWVIT